MRKLLAIRAWKIFTKSLEIPDENPWIK